MPGINDILTHNSHRPWSLPNGQWQYYQEWNNALFIHWEVAYEQLRKLVPDAFTLDSFDGRYYISLVAFTMQHTRPAYLPSLKTISDFHEVNIRTYICNNGKRGVYFLSIEAQKYLSALIARKLSGLPYQHAHIRRDEKRYSSMTMKKEFSFDATYSATGDVKEKSALDTWLTERYCLYMDINGRNYVYDIHHKEWQLQHVQFHDLKINYALGGILLNHEQPFLSHYSEGYRYYRGHASC